MFVSGSRFLYFKRVFFLKSNNKSAISISWWLHLTTTTNPSVFHGAKCPKNFATCIIATLFEPNSSRVSLLSWPINYVFSFSTLFFFFSSIRGVKLPMWPGLLEAWLVLTSVKHHGNLYILIPLNQRLALTRLRATGPWSVQAECVGYTSSHLQQCIDEHHHSAIGRHLKNVHGLKTRFMKCFLLRRRNQA